MFSIEEQNIHLNAQPKNKTDAIKLAGRLLADSGKIGSRYIKSLLKREAVSNTYIGSGIAIPHGMTTDRHHIRETAVAVVQVPDGVAWGEDTVYVIVCLAAKSDEHIDLIRRLTHLIDDPQALQLLRETDSRQDIIGVLTGAKAESPMPPPGNLSAYTRHATAVVPGSIGLHARPASVFTECARGFVADVLVCCADRYANGKSMAALLKLGAKGGDTITILSAGDDAAAAVAALSKLVTDGLNEDDHTDEAPETLPSVGQLAAWEPAGARVFCRGAAASPGVAVATVFRVQREELLYPQESSDPDGEIRQLQDALQTADRELEQLITRTGNGKTDARAAILRAHRGILHDPELLQAATDRIRQGSSAAAAWNQCGEQFAADLAAHADARQAERAADYRDVARRVLGILVGQDRGLSLPGDRHCILVADDLSPSDTAGLDPEQVAGICTAAGGPASHTAITARSLGIPAVVGCGTKVWQLEDGAKAAVNGFAGWCCSGLQPEDHDRLEELQGILQDEAEQQQKARFSAAVTTDGSRMPVWANIANASQAAAAVEYGAEGVGLLRSEFLFLERSSAPSEDEQYHVYREIAEKLAGAPLIVRTLDIGGDKQIPYLDTRYAEENPFLGVRGIRLCLQNRDLFRVQLRALYRASRSGDLRIMLPMVSSLEELREAREICREVCAQVGGTEVPIGIMIEVPSAVVLADELAAEADFFSVGTNDLTQYTLAMDRLHPLLSCQADSFHPAVLRMIKLAAEAARRHGIPCGVCGGMASDPQGAVLLTGMGIDELSVDGPAVPRIKAAIRAVSRQDAQQLAERAASCSTAGEVRQLLGTGGSHE
ncbi:phosphoenolpyruvate--protein phosphotransferase [Spirochaeta africana]|uniref:phosphoenolpyruvate--protein phosphotransferase n=1 Tax=Spirochaeta africana (strain ATCC 700263 / DSM 8902 / Z-7692) TaxID=889378 RepID=H9UGZ0_SPIAZ|nr:phosphoenolpyruvate--protein phosphotransferase [Spirochaeta africana]AFG36783.1 phosphotransferase system HPr (HPr) family protein [Spirochaeta africana DSM 8902]